MPEAAVLSDVDEHGIITATLNRPQSLNGLGSEILASLSEIFDRCESDHSIRALCLRANGKHFCAGAEMRRLGDGQVTAMPDGSGPSIPEVLHRLDTLRVPTVVLVHGACIGGAVALVSCCDIVIARTDAFFSISEVRLGIPPLPLLEFFLPKMGLRQLRRYALTGERFDAAEARHVGLVHQVCPADALDDTAARLLDALLHGAPSAVSETKAGLAAAAAGAKAVDGETMPAEATEGLHAFLEKRPPRWYTGPIEDRSKKE